MIVRNDEALHGSIDNESNYTGNTNFVKFWLRISNIQLLDTIVRWCYELMDV